MPNIRRITHDGITDSLKGWSERTGIPVATIFSRIEMGWDLARALSERPNRKFAKGGRKPADIFRPCPALRQHKAKGTAYVRWWMNGKERTRRFGPWGSKEVARRYAEFALEWASGAILAGFQKGKEILIRDVTAAWLVYCQREYRKRGKATSEVNCCRAATIHLNELYGDIPAAEFDARRFKLVREAMIEQDWTRSTINNNCARIVRCFAWAVTEKLAPIVVHQEIDLVQPLVAGRRDGLRESEYVPPVPAADIEAVLAGEHLHPKAFRREILAAMIRVQLLTGLRPGELCSLRAVHFERGREPWRYDFGEQNKMLHRESRRVAFFGPKARAILTPLIDQADGGLVFRFPPWRKKASWSDITPMCYRDHIRRACESAGVPIWTPNQLRHNRATEVMNLYEDDEATAATLGNTREVARQIYAERAGESVARRIAEATG